MQHNKHFFLFLFYINIFHSPIIFAQNISMSTELAYRITFKEPHTHYAEIEIQVKNWKQPYLDFKMATWTPGSYLIREYARNVEAFKAYNANNQPIKAEKINKNTWRVYNDKNTEIRFTYRLYARELTVRTSFIDISHAYLNPASVFMYIDKQLNLPSTLTIEPYSEWKKITTALKPVQKDNIWKLAVPDFDTLVDSPIEIGNHDVFEFTAQGIPHTVAMYGGGNYQKEKICKDFTAIIDAATSIFGENPCKDYVFIVHNLRSGGGGLEHLNSTTVQTSRNVYDNAEAYTNFLALVAHEYFHLWNVKRLRPQALGPFDYENENYTTMLWQAEGFTSYYEDLILLKANLITVEKFLKELVGKINTVENTPGNKIQSVAESSIDAWIKFYRPNENSNNSTVSYYTKGSLLAFLLDLEIIQATQGEKSLDDALKLAYQEFYKKQNRGFTDSEFQRVLEKVAGKSLQEFYDKYIYGTETPDYERILGYAGIVIENHNILYPSNKPFLGASFQTSLLTTPSVSQVIRGTAAYKAGLNVGDEVVSINDKQVTDIQRELENYKIGDTIKLKVRRDGIMYELQVVLEADKRLNYRLRSFGQNLTPEQNKVYQKLIRSK
ncbi:MAG: PDZ domain-containing protein [Microscillaceae bacterium]|nr:PDZ domain-containing protein [Microscillaceae bacterium]MDW8459991.1 PDZ domain-containing protein [Cytophagales bacterium]